MLILYRQHRCTELVSSRKMLHVPAEILQSLRGVPTSRVSRWPQPYFLVFHRSALLPNQSVSGCTRCILPCNTLEPVYLGGVVRSWHFGKSQWSEIMRFPIILTIHSTNPATIRRPTHWMLTSEHLILTPPICTSRHACSFYATTVNPQVCQISRMRLCHKTCIHNSTKLQASGLLLVLSGVCLLVLIRCFTELAQPTALRLTGIGGWQKYPIHHHHLRNLRIFMISGSPCERLLHKGK